MRQKVSAECRLRRYIAGKASVFIRNLDTLQPGDKVVLYCRVSIRDNKLNLADQEAALRAAVAARGASVVEVVHVQQGGADSSWLANAVAMAKAHGAKLVAESTDRFKRHRDYHSVDYPDLQATEDDLWNLRYMTEGVPLITLLDPDATPGDVRSYQSKRGQAAKGRRGGRPAKKRTRYQTGQREVCRSKLYWLCIVLGMEYRAVARLLNVPEANVRRWVRQFWDSN
jgi:hypothetical protein